MMAKSVTFLLSGCRLPCVFLVFSIFSLVSCSPVPQEATGSVLDLKGIRKISVDGGQQLVLGCDSYNMVTPGKTKMMWVRYNIADNSEVPLFHDTVKLRKQQRYHLINGFDLGIHNATYEDIAVFQCYDMFHPEMVTRYLVDVQNLKPEQQAVTEDFDLHTETPDLEGTTVDESGVSGNDTATYYDDAEEEEASDREHPAGAVESDVSGAEQGDDRETDALVAHHAAGDDDSEEADPEMNKEADSGAELEETTTTETSSTSAAGEDFGHDGYVDENTSDDDLHEETGEFASNSENALPNKHSEDEQITESADDMDYVTDNPNVISTSTAEFITWETTTDTVIVVNTVNRAERKDHHAHPTRPSHRWSSGEETSETTATTSTESTTTATSAPTTTTTTPSTSMSTTTSTEATTTTSATSSPASSMESSTFLPTTTEDHLAENDDEKLQMLPKSNNTLIAPASGSGKGVRQSGYIDHSADDTVGPVSRKVVSSAGRLMLTVTNMLTVAVCSLLIM
ncbi:uncharacterized protein DDB_G0271670-like [Paramacrobiotus metropolitanus]|uniref:uncharacterized protein DDB_G0271670-like n=1 Tax=Paramacrobiotus metropolitanus TaxID=2943436 RepID=UPI0024464695|nr:uncharacterized protein DDB_G0271670-like [Paramacrobiotus metropolitanus]